MEKYYQNMLNFIHSHKFIKQMILFINHYFTYFMYIIYPLILIYLLMTKNQLFLVTLIKPLLAFSIVTIIRKFINRKRPYETMKIKALFSHKSGQSFPSRHTVSAMIIALVCFDIHIVLGSFLLFIALCISLGRVLAGVHYISDVIVAMIIAFIIYLLKFF